MNLKSYRRKRAKIEAAARRFCITDKTAQSLIRVLDARLQDGGLDHVEAMRAHFIGPETVIQQKDSQQEGL